MVSHEMALAISSLLGFLTRGSSSHRNPTLEVLDDDRRQFRAVLGHLDILLFMADRPEQQALIRLASDDHLPAITALEQAAQPIQRQPALGLVAAVVALVTMLDEGRSNVFLEKLDLLRRGISQQANCRETKRQ